ncbi:MAG: hypothetical protein KBG75_01135 [Pseudomonadales bacterium]|nr:hypothetical protein [Pseudomonadales bacterium]
MNRWLGLVLSVWLLSGASHAAANPCWRELHFAAGNTWLAATTDIRYQTLATTVALAELQSAPAMSVLVPAASSVGQIHVSFEAVRSQGELDTWFDPGTGAALQSVRTSQGRDSRQKLHRFTSNGVWRERREAAPASMGIGSGWTPTTSKQIEYPIKISVDDPVITPLMLIEHAARLVRDGQKTVSQHLVFTDTQLYRVTLELAPEQKLAAKFTLVQDTQSTRVNEPRTARRVSINAQLLGEEAENDVFSLLELSGELAIYIDVRTGVPLRIEGTATGLGTVPVTISKAVLARDCGR